MIFAGEVASSGGRLGRQHTRMRRPPPVKAGNQRGHGVEFGDGRLLLRHRATPPRRRREEEPGKTAGACCPA
jgi:hypothetical protein